MKFRFHLPSLLLFLLFFLIELVIALYINDAFIRPFGGDILVIPLLYYFIKSVIETSTNRLIIAVVLFAFVIEFSQYFELIKVLGLERSHFWQMIIGTSYHWLDLVCYVAGGILTFFMEKMIKKPSHSLS